MSAGKEKINSEEIEKGSEEKRSEKVSEGNKLRASSILTLLWVT